MDQTLINRIVEAALLAANQPLGVAQLRSLFTVDEPAPEGAVEQALHELQAACADRGVALVEVASGWRYQVKADVHAWVARLWTERQTRYTRATLETLALIAYRQPITRGEIEQVRGVATSSNMIKALEEREWIRVVGHRDIPGRPELLGTTRAFLDYFGLKRLDDLPPLSELKDFGELEPQLDLGDRSPPLDGAMPLGDTPLGDAANDTDDDVNDTTAADADALPDDTTGATSPTPAATPDPRGGSADPGASDPDTTETNTALAEDGDSTRSQ
ncbi:SMC-Scp complex subunit ScpB [Luteimonas yindakuii]|uniref:SMC-Scp complex subunit ScpB n=1 Tax=Luteimonas yindakuii TaxID=2565782 RepID=A0A4Z1R6M5_9GAMM|nr:SMC-Scp complex subunit ScpB [Luteimonas yindakuii]